jgi:hypothetical protein
MSAADTPEQHEFLLSDRKHRLLACGLCRRVAPLIDRPELLGVLAAAEAFADGQLGELELSRAREFALSIARSHAGIPEQEKYALAVALTATVVPPSSRTFYKSVEPSAASLVDRYLRGALELLADDGGALPDVPGFAAAFADLEPRECVFDPAWRTDTAVALARQMYESRDFGAMPILADALQDAGCEDENILNHCRDLAQVHVRGCWVVDLVLGIE